MRKALAFVFLSLCLLGLPVASPKESSIPRTYFSGPGTTDYPWAMFHNNPKRTGVTAASGPSSPSLMWSFPTSNLVYSSPAVMDGKIFISSFDGNVYAIDEYTGQQDWVFSSRDYVSSSPAVANGFVYATTACPLSTGAPLSCNAGYVYALDENTGGIVWQKPEAKPIISSPLVADGRVFYGIFQLGNGVMLARNATTGNGIWQVYLSDAVESPPSLDNGRIFVGQADGAVVALNETNGAQLWRVVPFASTTFQTSPAVWKGMIFLGSTSRGAVALNENTGATVWTFGTGGFNTTSITVNAGRVYFGTGGSRVYSLNATTKALLWSATTGGAVASTPALALGSKTVFVGSNDGKLYAFNMTSVTTTGMLFWTYAVGGGVPSSPAVADGRVFFGSNDLHVYALGAKIPSLHISISSNSTMLMSGHAASLTVTVTNGTFPQSSANVTFASSVPGGSFSPPIMISAGTYQSNYTAPTVSSKRTTVIMVNATSAGFLSGTNQTSIILNPLPTLMVAVAPRPASITPGGEITLMIQVTNSTLLVSGASLSFSSSAGGSFSSVTDIGNGNYTAIFSVPLVNSVAVVTVQASKSGFTSGQGQTTVQVNGVPNLTTLKLVGFPFYVIVAVGVVLFLLVLAVMVRKKKGHHYAPPKPSFTY